mmetsp:Transcript_10893/g.34051  ORF Transcript_10893/g.34051 Transcript_10893/m.34051 type:complete len:201 (+) Transcript_10893:870-1472(+)
MRPCESWFRDRRPQSRPTTAKSTRSPRCPCTTASAAAAASAPGSPPGGCRSRRRRCASGRPPRTGWSRATNRPGATCSRRRRGTRPRWGAGCRPGSRTAPRRRWGNARSSCGSRGRTSRSMATTCLCSTCTRRSWCKPWCPPAARRCPRRSGRRRWRTSRSGASRQPRRSCCTRPRRGPPTGSRRPWCRAPPPAARSRAP